MTTNIGLSRTMVGMSCRRLYSAMMVSRDRSRGLTDSVFWSGVAAVAKSSLSLAALAAALLSMRRWRLSAAPSCACSASCAAGDGGQDGGGVARGSGRPLPVRCSVSGVGGGAVARADGGVTGHSVSFGVCDRVCPVSFRWCPIGEVW